MVVVHRASVFRDVAREIMKESTSIARGPIAESEVARLIGEYEETHAVDDYHALGYHLWPLLRIGLATNLYLIRNYSSAYVNPISSLNKTKSAGRLIHALKYFSKPIHNYIQWAWSVVEGKALAPSRPCDVLIFGGGGRYQFVGEKWVHYATGPFADLLEQAGLSCHVWQWEQQPSPPARPSANVESAVTAELKLADTLVRFRSTPPVPWWYSEYSAFYREQLGRHLSWESIVQDHAFILPMSNIFERWLRRMKPALIALDNWYSAPMFATALAAHRLGIPVMDLQHGVQEQTHSAYHWWRKEPVGGWGVRPGIFWVWGERTERLFHETNRIQQEILRGGNLWIRRWLSDTDPQVGAACEATRKLIDGHALSILVTLPNPASPCLGYLQDAIARSPPSWKWLVRAHPGESQTVQHIEKDLGGLHRGRVLLQTATEQPLYALMRTVDLHVSNDSTCANEALVFGKPTILISQPGLVYFREFVEAGVMFYAETPEEFCQTTERALQVDPARLKQAAYPVFTLDDVNTKCAVDRILQIVGSLRSKQAALVGA